jgi:hypothetical protein
VLGYLLHVQENLNASYLKVEVSPGPKNHAMKVYRGCVCKSPSIHNFHTGRR